jgi:hypothetical protein
LIEEVRALSPAADWVNGELVAFGGSVVRMSVLDVLRRRGVEIRALLAEDGRLEDLYRELVADYGEDVQPGGDRATATSARSAEEGS